MRPRATESMVSGNFSNFFRNFASLLLEKEMRGGPKMQTKFLLTPVTAAVQQPQPKQPETNK
ncbi:MAG: hypothetical protein DMF38_08565 [Verrucomicrobia bacterium]|nr:MAG: hypothetical protein DMF38_08565 [Verrucomicrobiota bacterium]